MLRLVTFKSLCIACFVFLAACAGGGGGSTGSTTPTSAPPSTGTPGGVYKITCQQGRQAIEGSGSPRHRGKIQRIENDGSVVVDDIRYSTLDASIYVNGACGNVGQLGVGHVVDVVGTSDDESQLGSATAIFSDDDVAGPILAIDLENDTINVSGQTVIVTPGTVYGDSIRPGSLAALGSWQGVAVSGVVREDRALLATRIDRWPAGWRATGVVSGLDTAKGVFRINQILVRYEDAAMTDFPEGVVHDGDTVRVQGDPLWIVPGYPCCNAEDGGINAAAVEYVSYDPTARTVMLSGLVTRWDGIQDFAINFSDVVTDSKLRHAGMDFYWVQQTPEAFWLTVIGTLDDRGTLHATMLYSENGGNQSITAPMTDIDLQARVLSVAGVRVSVDSSTVLRQVDGSASKPFDLADLRVGDMLFVWSYDTTLDGALLAMRLDKRSASEPFHVQSWFSTHSLQRPDFAVGIGGATLTIHTNSDTKYSYGHSLGGGCSCSGRTADSFWALADIVGNGMKTTKDVEVYGVWTGDHVVASKVLWLDE